MGDLSNAMQGVVDDIKSSAESRGVKVSEIKSDTHNLIERFRLEHQDMANALREKLSSDDTTLREATQQFMGDVKSGLQDMANALREKLSSDESVRKEATQQFMNEMANALREKLSSDDTTLREATQQFMNELASDRREAQEIWRRGFVSVVEEAAPEPVVKEEVEEEVAPQPVVEEKAAEEAVPEEEETAPELATEEVEGEEAAPSPEEQVLKVIARYPEGIRLVDIGNELGVDWRSLIGVVKQLEDRIEKIDNLYYPKS